MIAPFLATVLSLGAPEPSAYDEAQDRALDNLADISAMSALCPGSRVDRTMTDEVFDLYDLGNGGRRELAKRSRRQRARMAEFTTETACRAAWFLYGPDGINIKNFILFGNR